MIFYLYGPDDYRRRRKEKEIISEYRNKHSFSLREFDFEESASRSGGNNLDELTAFLKNNSLFGGTKLAVLKNISTAGEKIIPLLKSFLKGENVHLLVSEKEKPSAKFKFLLKKPVLAQEFDYLEGAAWQNFVKLTAERLGLKLTPIAQKILTQIYQNDTWGLVTEIEKLSFFTKNALSEKELEDFNLTSPSEFFQTLKNLKSPFLNQRLLALEKLEFNKEPGAKIFNVLGAIFYEKLPLLAEFDFKIKSGAFDYDEALLKLILDPHTCSRCGG